MLHCVILSDVDKIITDLVIFEDLQQADVLALQLASKFGKNRVQIVSRSIGQLPEFFGLGIEEAVEQTLAPDNGQAAA